MKRGSLRLLVAGGSVAASMVGLVGPALAGPVAVSSGADRTLVSSKVGELVGTPLVVKLGTGLTTLRTTTPYTGS